MHYFKLQKLEFKQLINDILLIINPLEILQAPRMHENNIIQWLIC